MTVFLLDDPVSQGAGSVSSKFAVTPPRHNDHHPHPSMKGPVITTVPNQSANSPFLDSPFLEAAKSAWLAEILEELRRIYLRRVHHPMDADDAAMDLVLEICKDAEVLMATFPTAVDCARAKSKYGLRQWQRKQRVQAGEGARLVTEEDGSMRPSRQRTSFETSPGAQYVSGDDTEYQAVIQASTISEVHQVLGTLRPADRWLLTELQINDRPSAEVRSELGCSDAAFRQRRHRAGEQFRDRYQRLSLSDV
jgi:DNA-directed RNA polymerase specialized sigma24 family protein